MGKLVNHFHQLYSFIRYDIWRITEYELSQTKRLTYRLIRIIYVASRGFIQDNLSMKASALTYSVLFALVPLIALFIAIGKGFGVEALIKDWMAEAFMAQKEILPTLLGFVDKYLETTQGGLFIGVGLVILLISVMNFFKQTENAFNSIWMVQKPRTFIRQFTTYISALFLVPVLIVLSAGIKIFFDNILADSNLINVISPLTKAVMFITPYVISWIMFVLIYLIVPNTRVKLNSALVAGIIAGTAFQLFQGLYINGQVYLARYDVVYGSFAAIPLLLLWLQISGMIVLFGAELSYATQNIQNYEYELDTQNISHRYKKFITLFLTYIIVKRFENSESPMNTDQLASTYKLPIRLINQILTELSELNIISEIYQPDLKTKCYQPAMDINQLTVQILFEKINSRGSELFLTNKNPLLDEFWEKTMQSNMMSEDRNKHLLIKDL